METRNKARIEILNYIIGFCTFRYYSSGLNLPVDKEHAFQSTMFGDIEAPVGSLVKLDSAPSSKYYLSWLKEIKKGDSSFDTQYLLESIEDGSLCWWSNVSIDFFSVETTNKFITWKWTDAQFDFDAKWKKACKKRDAYITLPCLPEFHEDGSVTLKTRERFGISDYQAERKFENWKKVTQKQMLEFYDFAVAHKPKAVSKSE